MFSKGWARKTLPGQSLGHITATFCGPAHFNNLTSPVISALSVNMSSALPISGIFAHRNTRDIIFPYLCGADLSEIEIPYQCSQVDGFLARL